MKKRPKVNRPKMWTTISKEHLEGFVRDWSMMWREQMRITLADWLELAWDDGYKQGRQDQEEEV